MPSTPTRGAGRWAAAVPSVSDCGTHRNSEQRRKSEPGTPVASNPRNALQNEGQGLSRLAEGRPPRVWRGADWVPPGLPACWRCDIESNYDPTAARSEVNRWCSAIAFSSVQNRLAVMCRLIEGGGGHRASTLGAAGLHRSYRLPDSPVPDRGEKSLKTTSQARQGNYHSGKETWEGDGEENMRNMRALEGDEGRRSDGDFQPETEGVFAPAARRRSVWKKPRRRSLPKPIKDQ